MVSRKPHPAELRERAVQMVFELPCQARGRLLTFCVNAVIDKFDVPIHGWRVIGRQASAGSGGSQGFPLSAARMASRARSPWFLAESR
jgi:hypothetical protein